MSDGLAAQSQLTMSCDANPEREHLQLKQNPHGARRLNKHTVEVRWSRGKRIFKDVPPYDQPFEGVRWTYCGYNAELKLHLIHKVDETLFTGVMLDDQTGTVIPGGESVLFSPNLRYYFAYEQENGRDGATTTLYSRNGKLQWEGYDGILTSDNVYIIAYFQETHWNMHNQLQTSATCLNEKKAGTLTLTSRDKSGWEWLPKIRC